jgi:hypothetical protein
MVRKTRSKLGRLAGILLAAGLSMGAAEDVTAQRNPAAPDFDVRDALPGAAPLSLPQQAALRANGNRRVALDARYGVPRSVAPTGRSLSNAPAADPESAARSYLRQNADLFGMNAGDINRLVVVAENSLVDTGSNVVVFGQRDQGRDVFATRVTVTVDALGRVLLVSGGFRPNASAPPAPALSAEEAVGHAAAAMGRSVAALNVRARTGGAAQRTVFANNVAARSRNPSDITAELVTFPMPGGRPARLAWATLIEESPVGWYETVVDALTGEVLYRRNLYKSAAEGNVYTVQHPGITGAAQQIVPFTGAAFDNNGWVADRRTSGNNVNAYQDTDGNDASDFQPETPASGDAAYQHFDYTFTNAWGTTMGTDITTDQAAVVTQLFYFANVYHDYLYGLGFTEANRNFQVDNFGRGGSGGDPVLAEADDSFMTECCNANFGTPADGSSPRMQMFVGQGPDNNWMQRAMNGDTVFHESSHGVSHRLVGGGTLGTGAQTDAMGEGWGDFFATSYWNDPVYGEYNNGNNTIGIRGVAYDNSTLKYSGLCSGGCEEHSDGEIWATVLWDLRTKLVARYGYSAARPTATPANPAGNRRAEQLVVDAMLGSGSSPDFLDMRDAILAADVARYAAADTCLIWGVFAAREMGFNAVSNSQSSVTAGTNGPASCTPVASAGGPYTTPEGTDAALSAAATTENGDGPFTYEWDLDNDGQYNDATGKSVSFTRVGQDGVFSIGVKVTNANGFSSTASTTVTVTNVQPTVTLGSNGPKNENIAITVTGTISDPGWLDPLTATIDWGDGSPAEALSGTLENVRPNATLTFSASHTYGDNSVAGGFTATVCANDDDAQTCNTIKLVIQNVDPTSAIDEAGAILFNGVPAFLGQAGVPMPFKAASTDPGSDDLTLKWDFADSTPVVSTLYLVNAPAADPLPSPSIQPRDVTDTTSHTFAKACLYEIVFTATDDDAGTSNDKAFVIMVGNAGQIRSAGYWSAVYNKKGPKTFDTATLNCYLKIAGFMSAVFNEATDASTIAKALAVLNVSDAGGSPTQLLDRQLLALWLNLVNGAVGFAELVDTNGDGTPDTALSTVLANAEAVRLNPASTRDQLLAQKTLLERINLTDGG